MANMIIKTKSGSNGNDKDKNKRKGKGGSTGGSKETDANMGKGAGKPKNAATSSSKEPDLRYSKHYADSVASQVFNTHQKTEKAKGDAYIKGLKEDTPYKKAYGNKERSKLPLAVSTDKRMRADALKDTTKAYSDKAVKNFDVHNNNSPELTAAKKKGIEAALKAQAEEDKKKGSGK